MRSLNNSDFVILSSKKILLIVLGLINSAICGYLEALVHLNILDDLSGCLSLLLMVVLCLHELTDAQQFN